MWTKNEFTTTYTTLVYTNINHNIFGFSTSVSKLQKQMPASKKTASNDVLDDHDVPETSTLMESSDNDAEVENEEKYETETQMETDCTTESDDENNNDSHPRYIFSLIRPLFILLYYWSSFSYIDYLGISFSFYSTDLQLLVQTYEQSLSTSCSYLSCCCYSSSATSAKQTILQWWPGKLVPKQW